MTAEIWTKRRRRFWRAVFLSLIHILLVFGITNARYYITGAGTGSAQAAAVAMNSTIDLTEKLSELKPGNTKTITFAVNNYKEAGKISEMCIRDRS